MIKPRILIGIITYDADWYCLKRFADSIAKLDLEELETEILIIDNSDTEDYMRSLKKFFPTALIKHYQPPNEIQGMKRFRHCEELCRKMVREYFFSNDYTHLFFVDSDVICPPESLKRLLLRNEHIVCAKFNYRDPPEGRTLWFLKKKPVKISTKTGVWFIDFISNEKLEWHEEHEPGRLIEIDACGFGAILISRSAIQKIQLRKSSNGHYGVDIHFCYDAKQIKFRIFGDPSIFCEHIYKRCNRRQIDNAHAF